MFQRPIYNTIFERIHEPRQFIQVLAGPRQTGKTTLAKQIMDSLDIPSYYASSDEPALKDSTWIEQQWEVGRTKLQLASGFTKALFVLDEVQKITGWSETVKRLWD